MGGCPILCQEGDGFIPQVEVAGLHLGPSQTLPPVSLRLVGPHLYPFKNKTGDFPGGPVVKTPHFHCRGCRFDPLSGN